MVAQLWCLASTARYERSQAMRKEGTTDNDEGTFCPPMAAHPGIADDRLLPDKLHDDFGRKMLSNLSTYRRANLSTYRRAKLSLRPRSWAKAGRVNARGPRAWGLRPRTDMMVDDVRAIARALGLGRFHVLGHTGGRLARYFAARHPEAISTVIVLAGSGRQVVPVDYGRLGEAITGTLAGTISAMKWTGSCWRLAL
jgi:hypothetical protein